MRLKRLLMVKTEWKNTIPEFSIVFKWNYTVKTIRAFLLKVQYILHGMTELTVCIWLLWFWKTIIKMNWSGTVSFCLLGGLIGSSGCSDNFYNIHSSAILTPILKHNSNGNFNGKPRNAMGSMISSKGLVIEN